MQNLFPPGKEARTRSLNTHYYVIFKNPRDQSQFNMFARQVRPTKWKALIEIFLHVTSEPYQYLFSSRKTSRKNAQKTIDTVVIFLVYI